MSTTSPNFNLVLATTSDVISVTSHISNNFSTVDSLFSQVHTGTGQLKASLTITTPTLATPTISGTLSGATFIGGSTGSFSTITATGGALTVNSLSMGTYGYPAAVGSTGYVLTVVTGNAVWASNSPNTGATLALNNLASVAINTSLNTFTAGFVTVARVIATSGALTGLTAFQASAGTFIGNVVISGTATINAVNCTGGSITAGGLTIGTYAYPGTIGSSGTTLVVGTGTLAFGHPVLTSAYISAYSTAAANVNVATGATGTLAAEVVVFDSASIYTTGNSTAVVAASGYYQVIAGARVQPTATSQVSLNIVASTNNAIAYCPMGGTTGGLNGVGIILCTSGQSIRVVLTSLAGSFSYVNSQGSFLMINKIPDV